jgi:phosphopantothenate---cysteine ligase (CTP)
MRCLVTAGPTFEPLDNVRRLTNFSTGRLGTELAVSLQAHGHDVTLLRGEQATYQGQFDSARVQTFSSTADLAERLAGFRDKKVEAVFHAAAVSDFRFGKVWTRSAAGELIEQTAGKLSTRQGNLLAELIPTSKIIAQLRDWFLTAKLIGWKFEVDGSRDDVIRQARAQMTDCRTDACVANGPAYGEGFGLLTVSNILHEETMNGLFTALQEFIR